MRSAADKSASPPAGSIHQLMLLYAPGAQRAALQAVLDVQAEIRASLRTGLDHSVAHARLAWWQGECERAANGSPSHPLLREIAEAARNVGGAAPDLRGLVRAATLDLAQAPLDDMVALQDYCQSAQGTLFAALAALLGADAAAARDVGTVLHVLEWLSVHAVTHATEIPAAEERLTTQLQRIAPELRPALRPLLVWMALSRWRAAQAIHLPADAPPPTLRLTMRQNLLAWRAARAAQQQRFP